MSMSEYKVSSQSRRLEFKRRKRDPFGVKKVRVKEAKHKFCNYLYDAMKHGRKKGLFIVEQK